MVAWMVLGMAVDEALNASIIEAMLAAVVQWVVVVVEAMPRSNHKPVVPGSVPLLHELLLLPMPLPRLFFRKNSSPVAGWKVDVENCAALL